MDLFKLVGRIAIENAAANEEIEETTNKAKGLKGELDNVGDSADTTSGKLKDDSKIGAAAVWLGNTLSKITEKAVNLGTHLAKIGFAYNSTLETYEVQFGTLLGDSERAAKFIEELREFDKATPLELNGLAKTSVMLLQIGTDVDEIIPKLEMLGNLSMGDPDRMNSVVRAYTQIAGKGGLMAQEMYQLGDAMVPVVDLLTKYGGERYADGMWYQYKMEDPKFKIPFEDLDRAFKAAVAEGGQYNDIIYAMMDTYAGQMDLLNEQTKQTMGALMEPFQEVAKSTVIPKLIESLGTFQTWVSENKETIDSMAESLGKMATTGFDAMLDMFKWFMNHGEAAAVAMTGVAAALTAGAVAAHPYATAIMAVVAGLAYLAARTDDVKSGRILEKYSQKDLDLMQQYVDAVNAAHEAEEILKEDMNNVAAGASLEAAGKAMQELRKQISDELWNDYHAFNNANGNEDGSVYLSVPVKTAEGTEAAINSELNSMEFTTKVSMSPDMSAVDIAVAQANYSIPVNVGTTGGATGIPGHATGLDRVPRDNYIARLHKDETVLNSTNAAIWRSGGMANTGRLEAIMTQLISLTQQLVTNTAAEKPIVLDTGAVVGQLAGPMDRQLGIMKNRRR